MRYLHTMLRIKDLEKSLDFFINKLGLVETKRHEVPAGKFTLIFLATSPGAPEVELTYNWGSENQEDLSTGRFFGHLAYEVDNIYEKCQFLLDNGVTINRPPRDGRMAFIKSPDGQSIELLQKGEALAANVFWQEMENSGTW